MIPTGQNNNISFIERSNLNNENARRLTTLMDFSVILNKREEINENDLSQNKIPNILQNEGSRILNTSLFNKKF